MSMIREAPSNATRPSLLLRLRDDPSAWGRFVTFYQPMLRSYVRSMRVAEHDGDDIVQGVLITLLRAMPEFRLDPRFRFRTWLYRVTLNAVRDHARKVQRRGAYEVALGDDAPEAACIDPEPGADWDKAVQRQVMQRAMDEVRSESDPRTWACFERHHLKQRDSAAVAEELGVSPESVRQNASRVLKRIVARGQEVAGEFGL